MKLKKPGTNTSAIEVTHIDKIGFWIFDGMTERHLSFSDFPWFEDSSIKAITNIEEESPGHLFWPDLDIDLSMDMIDSPEAYPLKYK